MSYTGARPFCCVTCEDVSEIRPSVTVQDVNIEEEVKKKIKGDKSVYLPEDVSNTYNCAECGNISQDTKYLTSHMKTVHNSQNYSKVFMKKTYMTWCARTKTRTLQKIRTYMGWRIRIQKRFFVRNLQLRSLCFEFNKTREQVLAAIENDD